MTFLFSNPSTHEKSRPSISRRRFLALGGGTVLWVTAGCTSASETGSSSVGDGASGQVAGTTSSTVGTASTVGSAPTGDNNNVLVVVQMMGGNDAINTLVPNTGAYADARKDLAIGENDRLALAGLDEYSWHRALEPLMPYWDNGSLAMAAGVAFDSQDRSHFEARDLWWRAQPGSDQTGWLARWMNQLVADDPATEIEGFALGFGPRALSGAPAPAVSNPNSLDIDAPSGLDQLAYEEFLLASSAANSGEAAILSAARSTAPTLISANRILADIADPYSADAYTGRSVPGLDSQLATAASLISTRPNLRVVTVGVEGFDTHADQLEKHAGLLGQTASAIAKFWESLSETDKARTTVMTISEFGRRVAPNDSLGTDHGRAGMQLVLGGGVQGGQLIGGFDLAKLEDGDLPMVVNELDIYADALRWLGGPVTEVLGSEPPTTGLIRV